MLLFDDLGRLARDETPYPLWEKFITLLIFYFFVSIIFFVFF
jgi:hypothetical protein